VWRLFVSGAQCSALFEIARVLMRFDHVARLIVKSESLYLSGFIRACGKLAWQAGRIFSKLAAVRTI